MQNIARMCGFSSDSEYQEAITNYSVKYKDYKKLETTVDHIQQDTEQLTADYQFEMRKVEPDIAEELQEKREVDRTEMETATKLKLKKNTGMALKRVSTRMQGVIRMKSWASRKAR